MKQIKILVVDDIEKSRKLLERIIKKNNDYLIINAENGTKALEKVKRENPDLILLDIVMPDINGFEVAKRLV